MTLSPPIGHQTVSGQRELATGHINKKRAQVHALKYIGMVAVISRSYRGHMAGLSRNLPLFEPFPSSSRVVPGRWSRDARLIESALCLNDTRFEPGASFR